MNGPNTPAPDVDLSESIQYGCNTPFWLQAARGHDRYRRGRLLCPVCRTSDVRFDPHSTTSAFTGDRHFAVDFGTDEVREEKDSGACPDTRSLVIDFVCGAGHQFEVDLYTEADGTVSLSAFLSPDDYAALYPAECEKWKGR